MNLEEKEIQNVLPNVFLGGSNQTNSNDFWWEREFEGKKIKTVRSLLME